jgi:hypothetical protein
MGNDFNYPRQFCAYLDTLGCNHRHKVNRLQGPHSHTSFMGPIEQHILDTNAGKQQS